MSTNSYLSGRPAKPDVLFVAPPFHFQRFNRYDDQSSGGHMIYYPQLGMMTLAAQLESAGFSSALIDAEAEGLDSEALAHMIRAAEPGILGITVTSPTLDSTLGLIRELNSDPSTKPEILLGGPHVSLDPGIVEFLGADFGLAGEADWSIIDFCRWRLKRLGGPEQTPGLIRAHQPLGPDFKPAALETLEGVRRPRRDIAEGGQYFSALWGTRVTSVLASRGCPFNCRFCDRSVLGRKFLTREPWDVIAEVGELTDRGFRFLTFVDEVFTCERDWCLELARGLSRLPVEFSVQTRADLVDRELLRELGRAGCRLISFGVETGDPRSAAELGKAIDADRFFDAVALAHDAGLMVNAFYMIGLPGDYEAQYRRTLALARKLNTEFATVNILSRLPGSALGRERWEQDKQLWRQYALGREQLPIFHNEPGDRERLVKLCKSFYRNYYLRPALVWRHLRRIRNMRDAAHLVRQARVFATQYAT